ncbi:MAG: hypothetical protein L6R28_20195 [Planctomycetes bacterium]|nr:hypothetical protein [Planctomycetota bacterium]
MTPELVVLVLCALASFWGAFRIRDIRDAGLLAVGFDPRRLGRLIRFLNGQKGAARLLEINNERLLPSSDLLLLFLQPISPVDAAEIMAEIAAIPVSDRPDAPDNRSDRANADQEDVGDEL